jgi:hypothetical protein
MKDNSGAFALRMPVWRNQFGFGFCALSMTRTSIGAFHHEKLRVAGVAGVFQGKQWWVYVVPIGQVLCATGCALVLFSRDGCDRLASGGHTGCLPKTVGGES